MARRCWPRRVLLLCIACKATRCTPTDVQCDVIVIGGSVAGLSAAVTSAKEGARTCLLSPTDMLGGQMTSNGIPALDFATENGRSPFNVSGATPDTLSANQPADFVTLLHSLHGPNYRNTCWVSPYCFLPTDLESNGIAAMLTAAGPNLRVFRQTVLLNVTTQQTVGHSGSQPIRVESARAVQRTAVATAKCGGYDVRLSKSLPDWYSPEPSARFGKEIIQFTAPVWVDTSYNGELLALVPGAPFLQGIDEAFDGDVSGTAGNDTIGQSFTMTFQSQLHDAPVPQPEDLPAMDPGWNPDPFRASPAIHTPTNRLDWFNLWTRRRSYHSAEPPRVRSPMVGEDPPPVNNVSVGDVHLAAWSDFNFRYIFTSKKTTEATVGTPLWVGGYDLASIDGAERYSYGAYVRYAQAAPPQWLNHTDLNSSYMGTCTGLSKMPYIRDGRRSVGVGNFIIDMNFTNGYHTPTLPTDCVALMGHGFDIWGHHMMEKQVDDIPLGVGDCAPNDAICNAYPAYMREGGNSGYTCAPLRAFTNAKVANLVVGGYTMAQSFMLNSALRMHPEEFQGGVAAGATAAHMAVSNVQSTEAALASPAVVAAIQTRVRRHAPLQYAGGSTWPPAVGFICAYVFQRCVQVPGGGTFTRNNTWPTCPGACVPLATNEWLAISTSYVYDAATKTATFGTATRIKKSTVNSGMIPGNESLAIKADAHIELTTPPSSPLKVDKYTYVLLTCATSRCGQPSRADSQRMR